MDPTAPTPAPAEPLLDATGVAKRYGAVVALRDASLSVRRGEIHALMGANGAGKSTFVKILTGAVRPDAGTISVARQHPRRSTRRSRLGATASSPSTRSRRSYRTSTWRSNLRLTETPLGPFREKLEELGLPRLDLGRTVRLHPARVAPHHRPRARPRHRARHPAARRDDRCAASQPQRARPRDHRPHPWGSRR